MPAARGAMWPEGVASAGGVGLQDLTPILHSRLLIAARHSSREAPASL